MKKVFIGIASILLVLAGAAIGITYYRNSSYELIKPRQGPIKEAVYGLGKVRSIHRFETKFGVMTTIRHLFVREGDLVKAGAKLLEIDSGAVIKAPFDGTVTLVASYEGETVPVNVTLLRLEDLTDRFIELSLEQEGALRVKRGQEAKVSFETLRGQTLKGQVRAVFPREDEFLAHIQVDDLSEMVLPGMSADVSVEVGEIANALLVPLKAIHNGLVVVKRGGKQEKLRVDVGHIDGMWAEIKNNVLKESDEILVPRGEAK